MAVVRAPLYPGLDGCHDLLLADAVNRLPEKDWSQGSDNWKRLRIMALAMVSLHRHGDVIETDLWPDTCSGLDSVPPSPMLDRHGFIRGVLRKPATAAYRAAAFRAPGTEGSTVAINTELVHQDGTIYIVTAGGTVGAGGYVDLDIAGDDREYPDGVLDGVGKKTRKQAGEYLTFVSPPAGIASRGQLVLPLNQGGVDRESDAAYRPRILDKIAQPGMGGNANDYRTWAMAEPGVDEAYVYPTRNGLGSVDLAFLHSGTGAERIPTEPERDAVKDAIDVVRPIATLPFRVLEVVENPVLVEIRVEPVDAEWEFDFYDAGGLYQVSAWDAATRKLTFVARPPDLIAGHRIVYKNVATPNTGMQALVEALGPGDEDVTLAAQMVVLDPETEPAVPLEAPEVGALVYSGGPLTEPVRRSIVELADSLGPGRGLDPLMVNGRWDDTLRSSVIFKEVQLHEGVLETYPVTPTANVVAANSPPAATVGLVTISQAIVRKA